jgi:hypothetical protein
MTGREQGRRDAAFSFSIFRNAIFQNMVFQNMGGR